MDLTVTELLDWIEAAVQEAAAEIEVQAKVNAGELGAVLVTAFAK